MSNEMQHKRVYLLFCMFTPHVSGGNHSHHQEYTKTVTTASGTVQLPSSNVACLWFRASLIYTNCPTRCNTKHSIHYSASSLYMFRVSTTPIIKSTQNCNYSLRYCAATFLQRGMFMVPCIADLY